MADVPYCINIIDTPGVADVDGGEADTCILKMVGELVNNLETIDYILLT